MLAPLEALESRWGWLRSSPKLLGVGSGCLRRQAILQTLFVSVTRWALPEVPVRLSGQPPGALAAS